MAEETESTLGQRLPGPLRLRSAGFGVVAGGVALAALSLVAPFGPVSATLLVAAVAGAVLARGDQVLIQICVGVGAIGAIGLLEAYTATALGLSGPELGGVAAVLGLVDIFLGTAIERFKPGSEE